MIEILVKIETVARSGDQGVLQLESFSKSVGPTNMVEVEMAKLINQHIQMADREWAKTHVKYIDPAKSSTFHQEIIREIQPPPETTQPPT